MHCTDLYGDAIFSHISLPHLLCLHWNSEHDYYTDYKCCLPLLAASPPCEFLDAEVVLKFVGTFLNWWMGKNEWFTVRVYTVLNLNNFAEEWIKNPPQHKTQPKLSHMFNCSYFHQVWPNQLLGLERTLTFLLMGHIELINPCLQ